MRLDELRHYCLSKEQAGEDLPFGPDVLVFRVLGKMFALVNVEGLPRSVNLKCDPEWAMELRESYPDIEPGYHMNKKHWNTVQLEGELSDDFLVELIDHSYDLVVAGLPKSARKQLGK